MSRLMQAKSTGELHDHIHYERESCASNPSCKPVVDLRIEGQGFYSIIIESETGCEWYDENVCDDGTPYTDSQQYAFDIAQAATDDGLVVVVNGYLFLSGGLRGQAA